MQEDVISIRGAREHNLKNIHLDIPRHKLVVFTGLSGSGKSSLAFDTLFAEGQRRYMETFSAYARRFIGEIKRPDVDKIEGLSPVIAIEQKTVSKNPRSTVGTITEVYDFLRLLFARTATAYSYETGKEMRRFSEQEIITIVAQKFSLQKIMVLAPLVKGRKGHYKDLFAKVLKSGYNKMRIDGEMVTIAPGHMVDRYKIHDIELVVDRILPAEAGKQRITESVRLALKMGKGIMSVVDVETNEMSHFSQYLMDPETGLSYQEPQPNTFSFNSPYGACPTCGGLGSQSDIDIESVIPDKKLSINRGGLAPLGELKENWTFTQIRAIGKKIGFSMAEPIGKISNEALQILLYGSDEKFTVQYIGSAGKKTNYETRFKGVIPLLLNAFHEKDVGSLANWAQEFMKVKPCVSCNGQRLKKESLHYKIDNYNIGDLASMSIGEQHIWLQNIEEKLTERQKKIGKEIFKEIRERIGFLVDVGLDYLNLNNPAKTLSGGEAQRIRLATQIGSKLEEVLYILDEPSIGLHQRDNHRLIKSLESLRDMGNSVIVVEHDKDMILEADFVVDLGPKAGVNGGEVIAAGSWSKIKDIASLTTDYILDRKQIEIPKKRRKGNGKKIVLKGCSGNNLKKIDIDFPLGKFICVTGVSGSGKSTLINETLHPLLATAIYKSKKNPLKYKSIQGVENIDKVIKIDQSPIGRTPRSNPATYTGFFTDIRTLFASLQESKIRGYKPGRYSFNVKGGRCETCKGGGKRVIEMNFLPDVWVNCEDCNGKRYNRETLEVRYKGKSISDILDMTVEHAVPFFESVPSINRKLTALYKVGLGYITLGQSSTTLSGGEAQRVKLASELSKVSTGKTFYILDEPTTGLHFDDIKQLLNVLNNLVNKGNTVLVVEHNLDVVKVADYIIDLGPEGGKGGGLIVNKGTPEKIVKEKVGHTAKYLADELPLI